MSACSTSAKAMVLYAVKPTERAAPLTTSSTASSQNGVSSVMNAIATTVSAATADDTMITGR